MVKFKQFYTQRGVSQLLISLLEHKNPATCLELSAGEGALLDSALLKFPLLSITACDIDPKNVSFLQSKYSNAVILCIDSTSKELFDELGDNRFDIALCNPPFHVINNTPSFKLLIEDVFGCIIDTKKIRAEIIFMAINLLYLKEGGELAIVLPDLFYSSASYNWLREALIKRFSVKNIIECEHRAFLKTEAKTYIFHIIKKIKNNNKINLLEYKEGTNIKSQKISPRSLINETSNINTYNNEYYLVSRGRLSGKECKASGLPYFHTNSFNEITYDKEDNIPDNYFHTKNGDILIARVGSRVVGEHDIFKGEKAIISDCIFCLRFLNNEFRDYFLDFWIKNKNSWLQENLKGTCAKHISLMSIRILLNKLLGDFISEKN